MQFKIKNSLRQVAINNTIYNHLTNNCKINSKSIKKRKEKTHKIQQNSKNKIRY